MPSALEYEKAHSMQLQPFFNSSLPNIQHEEVKGWGEDLLRERQQQSSSGHDDATIQRP